MSIEFSLPCLVSGKIDTNNLYDISNGGFSIYVNNDLIEVKGINSNIHNDLLKVANYISSKISVSYKISNNHLYLYPISNDSENFSISLASPPSDTHVSDISSILSLTENTGAIVINSSSSNQSNTVNWIETGKLGIDKVYYTRINNNNFNALVSELLYFMDLGVISDIKVSSRSKNIDITNNYNGKSVRLYFNDIVIKRYNLSRSEYCDLDPIKYKYLLYYSMSVNEFNSINNPE